MPFKTFVSGEILTATDVNTQIMGQQICVFADASARDASISSPSEGQFAYISDVNKLTFFDGSVWKDF